jgi:hypothetical protein
MGILAMRRGKLELIIDQKDRPQCNHAADPKE